MNKTVTFILSIMFILDIFIAICVGILFFGYFQPNPEEHDPNTLIITDLMVKQDDNHYRFMYFSQDKEETDFLIPWDNENKKIDFNEEEGFNRIWFTYKDSDGTNQSLQQDHIQGEQLYMTDNYFIESSEDNQNHYYKVNVDRENKYITLTYDNEEEPSLIITKDNIEILDYELLYI